MRVNVFVKEEPERIKIENVGVASSIRSSSIVDDEILQDNESAKANNSVNSFGSSSTSYVDENVDENDVTFIKEKTAAEIIQDEYNHAKENNLVIDFTSDNPSL
eukprot:g568.t1